MGIDPFTGAIIGGIGSALIGGSSSRSAANQISGASDAATAEQRRQFDIATGLAQPAIGAGNTARDQLMALLGLSGGQSTQSQGYTGGNFGGTPGFPSGAQIAPGLSLGAEEAGFGGRQGRFPFLNRQPGGPVTRGGAGGFGGTTSAGGSQDPLDIIRNTPGYQFQTEQGTRALNANRSAGGISGGELTKDFARFNQGLANNFYTQYANQLAGLAGSAQSASSTLGAQGIQSGQIIGNSLQNAGNARASGVLGQSNAFGGAFSDIFELLGNRSSGGGIGLSGSNGGPI